MSRLSINECDDQASFLRACAWEANTNRHLAGKLGQKALRELEAALLALPEKALTANRFIRLHGPADDVGEVCALGALALKRRIDAGESRAEAVKKIAEDWKGDAQDEAESEGSGDEEAAYYLNLKRVFAWAIIDQNEEAGPHDQTPEDRYRRVLAWVQKRIGGRTLGA